MPELAEVAIMANFITEQAKDVIFEKVEKSPESKVYTDLTIFGDTKFTVCAKSRGKELMIVFSPFHLKLPTEILQPKTLLMSMGMSGNWVLCKERKGGFFFPKHSHLRMIGVNTQNGKRVAVCLVDTRRFAKWKWKENFSIDRSPCPSTEHDLFVANFISKVLSPFKREEKFFNTPALDILMNQSLFNGIGNYLRAEIFYRANVNPFKSFSKYEKDEIETLLRLCKIVPDEAMAIGGGEIKDWSSEKSNREKFAEWLTCYQKGSSVIDKGKRKFWFDPKWEFSIEYLRYVHSQNPEIVALEKEIVRETKRKIDLVKSQMYEAAAQCRERERSLLYTLTKKLIITESEKNGK